MIERVSWAVLALIHALPALALFRPALIERLYGTSRGSISFLLLHHRAALFLVVFTLCIWAAFDPASRRIAAIAVGISMLSFLVLYWMSGSPDALRSIAIADLVGIPFLLFVAWKAFTI